jgi:hypothetical protein
MFLLHVRLPPACGVVATQAHLHWDTRLPLHAIAPLFEVPDVDATPWAAVMRNLCAAVTLEEELIPNGNGVGRVGYARLQLDDTGDVRVVVCFGAALPSAKLLMPSVFEQLQCWPAAVATTTPLAPFFGDQLAPCVRVRQLWHTMPCEPRHVHTMLMNVAAADAAQRAASVVRGAAHRARPMRLGASPGAAAAVAAAVAAVITGPDAGTEPHAATQAALASWMLTVEQQHPVTQCLAAPLVTQTADLAGGRDVHGVPLHGGVVIAMPGGGRRALVQLLCRADTVAPVGASAPDAAPAPPLSPPPPHYLAELQLCRADDGAAVDFAQLQAATPRRAGGTLLLAATAAEATRWFAALSRAGDPSCTVLLYTGRARAAHAAQLHTFDVVVTTYATLQREDAAEEHDAQRWCAGATMRCPDVEYVCSESESAGAPADARDAVLIQSRWYVVTRPPATPGRVFGRWLPPGRVATNALPAPEVQLAVTDETPRRKVGVCTARRSFALPTRCDTCGQTYPGSLLAAVRALLPRGSPLAQVTWRRVVCDDADVLNKRGVGRSVHAMVTSARRWCLLRPDGADTSGDPAQWLRPDVLRPLHGPLAFVANRVTTPTPREDTLLGWHMEPLIAVLPPRPLPAAVPPHVLRVALTCGDAARYDARRRACADLVRMYGRVAEFVVWQLASVCVVAPAPAHVALRFPEDCCPVCHEHVKRDAVVALPCGHGFCASCMLRMLVQHRTSRCEYCRHELAPDDVVAAVCASHDAAEPAADAVADAAPAAPATQPHRGSHKLAAVVELLRSDADAATLLVAFFKSSIALLARELRDADIPVVTVTSAKAAAVDAAARVTLTTPALAATSSAINLRSFARVVVLDAALHSFCAASSDVAAFRRAVASLALPAVHVVTRGTVEELLYDATEGVDAVMGDLPRHLEPRAV